MHADHRGAEQELGGEVTVGDRVHRVGRGGSAELLATPAGRGGTGSGERARDRAGRWPRADPSRAADRRRGRRRARARGTGGRGDRRSGCRWVMPGAPSRRAPRPGSSARSPAPPAGTRCAGHDRAGRAAGRWRPGRCGCDRPLSLPPSVPRAFQQAAFQRGRGRPRLCDGGWSSPLLAGSLQVVQGPEHAGQFVARVSKFGAVQHPGVRARGQQVVRDQPPVEVHAHRKPGQRVGRTSFELCCDSCIGLPPSFTVVLPPHSIRDLSPLRQTGRPGRRPSRGKAPQLDEASGQGLVEKVSPCRRWRG